MAIQLGILASVGCVYAPLIAFVTNDVYRKCCPAVHGTKFERSVIAPYVLFVKAKEVYGY
jgi:hypothetical protein